MLVSIYEICSYLAAGQTLQYSVQNRWWSVVCNFGRNSAALPRGMWPCSLTMEYCCAIRLVKSSCGMSIRFASRNATITATDCQFE